MTVCYHPIGVYYIPVSPLVRKTNLQGRLLLHGNGCTGLLSLNQLGLSCVKTEHHEGEGMILAIVCLMREHSLVCYRFRELRF